MYLHTKEYYQRELQVPDLDGQSHDGEASSLEVLADGIPRLFLENALGDENFTVLDGFVTDGVLDNEAPQKWLDLVNGKEYTSNGVIVKWKGLAYEQGAFKVSILAYITYYTYLLEKVSNTSGIGEIVGNSKNATNVQSTQKLTKIWNEFVKMNQNSDYYNRPNISYHNGIRFTDWLGNNSNEVSLTRFLEDNKTEYPDAPCKRYEVKNQFGI